MKALKVLLLIPLVPVLLILIVADAAFCSQGEMPLTNRLLNAILS